MSGVRLCANALIKRQHHWASFALCDTYEIRRMLTAEDQARGQDRGLLSRLLLPPSLEERAMGESLQNAAGPRLGMRFLVPAQHPAAGGSEPIAPARRG